MKKNQKTGIILAMCLIFLMPGYTSSNEEKVNFQSTLSDKVQTGKRPKYQSGLEFPWTQWEFSMDVPRSNPQIDNEAVENTFGPILGYKPIYLNPYTKKEITNLKGLYWGSFQDKFQPEGTEYKTPMSSPVK